MFASVSVPVLSVMIRVVEPSVSAAMSVRVIPFFLAMRSAPMERMTVRAIGKASGTAPTETATESTSISNTDSPRAMPSANMPATMTTTTANIIHASREMPFCRGVLARCAPETIPAILPISVSSPVETITAVAKPVDTIVPAWAMPMRSETGAIKDDSSVDFSTGADSPVSTASSIEILLA